MRTRGTAAVILCFILATVVHGDENRRKADPAGPERVSAASTEEQVVVSVDIYRIMGDISGNLSLTDSVWPGRDERENSEEKGYHFFTIADLKIAGVAFKAGEGGWTWNGEQKPPETERIDALAAPVVISRPGERFELRIGSDQPVAYFVKRADGLFELESEPVELGLTVTATPKLDTRDRVVLEDFRIEFRSIRGREPIEGVPLDVGAPKIDTEEYSATVSLQAGRDYGLQILTDGKGVLLVRIRVDRVATSG